MMEIVPIRQVKPGDNIRHALGNLGPLVKSIEAVGILEPLLVEGVDDSYTVIAGHRRLAAAKKAGLKEIPVIVMDFTEAEIAEAMLIENLQREDLSPIEEAEGLFRLETLGVTRKDMAARTGIPAKRIRERITLLDLPKQAQEKVHQRELPIEVGLLLASEPAEIVLELIESGTSARDLRWQLEAAKSRRKNAETLEKLTPRIEKLEAQGIP
ncbi:MAG: ParB/RepB/Spo0J family partition protein, partial [Acidimicrobiia bacterium]